MIFKFSMLLAPLVLISMATAPLQNLRLAGVNLTVFDLVFLLVVAMQLAAFRTYPALPRLYWIGVSLFLFGAGLSTIFAMNASASAGHLIQYAFIFLVVVPGVFRLVRQPESTFVFMLGFGLSALVFVVHGFVDMQTGSAQYAGGRYLGFLNGAQPTSFAISSFACFVAVGGMALKLPSTRLLAQIIFTCILGGLVWIVLLTGSRTGMLALFLSLSVTLLMLLRRARGDLELPSIPFMRIVLPCIIAAGTIVAFTAIDEDTIAMLERRVSSTFDPESDNDAIRTASLVEALEDIGIVSTVMGKGLDNYQYHSEFGIRPHNFFLLTMVEAGGIALLGLLILFGLALWAPLRLQWGGLDRRHKLLLAAGFGGFAAFLVICMFNTQGLHRLYWINFAILISAFALDDDKRAALDRPIG